MSEQRHAVVMTTPKNTPLLDRTGNGTLFLSLMWNCSTVWLNAALLLPNILNTVLFLWVATGKYETKSSDQIASQDVIFHFLNRHTCILFCFLLSTRHCVLLHFLGALYFHTTNKTTAGFTWKRTETPVFKWTRICLCGPFRGQSELSCHPRRGQMKLTFEKWEDTAVYHKYAVSHRLHPLDQMHPHFASHRLESSLFQVTYFMSFP